MSSPICPICSTETNIHTAGLQRIAPEAAPFIRHDYRTYACGSCDFYFTHPAIDFTQSEWAELYGNTYFAPMNAWWKLKRASDRKYRLDLLADHCRHGIKSFLDAGTGEGYVAYDALQRGWDVHAVDISDNRKDFIRDSAITFTPGTVDEAAFPDDTFDGIYLDSVLEHMIDPLKLLHELQRILKPGGVLYIGVPNETSLLNDFKKLAFALTGKGAYTPYTQPFKTPYHVVGFTDASLKKIAGAAGLKTAFSRNFGGSYEWRKYRLFSKLGIANLILAPLYSLSSLFGKDFYYERILSK